MTTYTDFDTKMKEAQKIIADAEDAYEHQRFMNGGDVTCEMEDTWYAAVKRAEVIQAEAARDLLFEQQLARDERQQESYLRAG